VDIIGPVYREGENGQKMGDVYRPYRRIGAVLDFPWSLALDLVLLPFTIPMELFDGS
jgi:uncharacterized protein YceK